MTRGWGAMLEEIKKHIKEQKFDLALELIEQLSQQNITHEDRLELLHLSLKISHDSKTFTEALELSFKLQKYSAFIGLVNNRKNLSLRIRYQLAVSLYQSGRLHKSFQEFETLVELLYSSGNLHLLLEIITFTTNLPVLFEVHSRACYYHSLLSGEVKNAESFSNRIDESFSKKFYRHPETFKFDKELHLYQLEFLLRKNEREKFIKGCLEFIAIFGRGGALDKYLSEYAVRFKRINLGFEMAKFNPDLTSLFPEKIAENEIEIGEIDSAQDLFSSGEDGHFLVRTKIMALLKLSQEDQATLLLKEFLKENPRSELKEEFSQLLEDKSGTRVIKRRVDIDQVMGELLKLTNRSGEWPKQQVEIDQRTLRSFIEYQDKEFIIKNFRDLIYCFIMLSFYELALWVIEKYIEFNPKDNIEARFLRCDVYLLSGQYHYGLDETLAIWNHNELNFEEELEILYKRAECYRLMGKKEKAIELYQEVHMRDSSYRLTKIRLQEFE